MLPPSLLRMRFMNTNSPKPTWERFDPARTVGAHVFVYDAVDSTMDVAWALADAGYPHGTAVRASTQRTGRGRFSRRWISGRDESLLLSVVLRNPPVATDAPISVGVTLAVANTVAAIAGLECGIKWPNDVQVDGRKIAGVLVEARVTSDRRSMWVMGVGLNVNMDPTRDPQLDGIATSISHASGNAADLDTVQDTLLANLDSEFDAMTADPAVTIHRWKAQLTTLGQEITVHERDRVLTGVAVDVDRNGHLLLRTNDRMVHVLVEGDVTLRS
jgi:BirA family biotin operon repressor/biotin-[acetyl-CoA-carboxylase] ligase